MCIEICTSILRDKFINTPTWSRIQLKICTYYSKCWSSQKNWIDWANKRIQSPGSFMCRICPIRAQATLVRGERQLLQRRAERYWGICPQRPRVSRYIHCCDCLICGQGDCERTFGQLAMCPRYASKVCNLPFTRWLSVRAVIGMLWNTWLHVQWCHIALHGLASFLGTRVCIYYIKKMHKQRPTTHLYILSLSWLADSGQQILSSGINTLNGMDEGPPGVLANLLSLPLYKVYTLPPSSILPVVPHHCMRAVPTILPHPLRAACIKENKDSWTTLN